MIYGYIRRATEFGAAAAALGEEEAQRHGAALPFFWSPEMAAISMVTSIVNSTWLFLYGDFYGYFMLFLWLCLL